MSEQAVEFFDVELLRVKPMQNLRNRDSNIDHLTTFPVSQENRNTATSLPLECAVSWYKPDRHEAHATQAGFVQLSGEFDVVDIRRAHHFERCPCPAPNRQGRCLQKPDARVKNRLG